MWKKFENALKRTCIKYRQKKLAVIQYINIPVEANRMKQSTVDFFGVYSPHGKGIAFDAKQTMSKTSFPLSNVKQHQIEFIRYWTDVGGDGYFFVQFYKVHGLDKFFMVPGKFIIDKWDNKHNGPKSIKLEDFKDSWLKSTDNFLEYVYKK